MTKPTSESDYADLADAMHQEARRAIFSGPERRHGKPNRRRPYPIDIGDGSLDLLLGRPPSDVVYRDDPVAAIVAPVLMLFGAVIGAVAVELWAFLTGMKGSC